MFHYLCTLAASAPWADLAWPGSHASRMSKRVIKPFSILKM